MNNRELIITLEEVIRFMPTKQILFVRDSILTRRTNDEQRISRVRKTNFLMFAGQGPKYPSVHFMYVLPDFSGVEPNYSFGNRR